MKLRWSPLRLGLVGVTLFGGSGGWLGIWLRINPVSPVLSDRPTPPASVRFSGWAGMGVTFHVLGWSLSRGLRGKFLPKE